MCVSSTVMGLLKVYMYMVVEEHGGRCALKRTRGMVSDEVIGSLWEYENKKISLKVSWRVTRLHV